MSKLTNFQNAEIKDASNLQGQYCYYMDKD